MIGNRNDRYTKAVDILGPEKGIEFFDRWPDLAGSFVLLRGRDGKEQGMPVRVVSKRFGEFIQGEDEIPRAATKHSRLLHGRGPNGPRAAFRPTPS